MFRLQSCWKLCGFVSLLYGMGETMCFEARRMLLFAWGNAKTRHGRRRAARRGRATSTHPTALRPSASSYFSFCLSSVKMDKRTNGNLPYGMHWYCTRMAHHVVNLRN
jgi:hypothetical protein